MYTVNLYCLVSFQRMFAKNKNPDINVNKPTNIVILYGMETEIGEVRFLLSLPLDDVKALTQPYLVPVNIPVDP